MSALVLILFASPEALFREAEALRRGEKKSREAFAAAAAAYEAVRAEGASNAGLYRSLGSAYLLSGDLPRAILMYRLGLRAEPGDAALTAALEAARERVVFADGQTLGRPPEPRRSWRGGLFVAAALAWLAACVGFTRWRMRRVGQPWASAVALALGVAACGWLLLMPADAPRPVVVIAANGVPLRKGDGDLFPPRHETALNRGVEAEEVFRRGDWLLIELTGGERGWVARRDVVSE